MPPLVTTRNVRFDALDHFPLAGTLFSNPSGSGPLVLVNSATAVKCGYYTKFALACLNAGARAALIYDYRGVAESSLPRGWTRRVNMKDWGTLDMPGAINFLDSHCPGHPMVGIGHSIGGTNLGLCGKSDRFQRFLMVGSAIGTLSMTDEKIWLYIRMNLVGRALAALLGKAPKWMGIGTDLPGSIFSDWARWCGQPNYLFDDPDITERDRFAKVRTPILSVSIHDDLWATPRAVRAHHAYFPNAQISRCVIKPGSSEPRPIGHLGFFRSRFSKTLWPDVIDWMVSGTPGNSGGPAYLQDQFTRLPPIKR
jgi:predicted alpha/beta hydrolase